MRTVNQALGFENVSMAGGKQSRAISKTTFTMPLGTAAPEPRSTAPNSPARVAGKSPVSGSTGVSTPSGRHAIHIRIRAHDVAVEVTAIWANRVSLHRYVGDP